MRADIKPAIEFVDAITTCSARGWKDYGKRMVRSWCEHWPVPLTVWVEGFNVGEAAGGPWVQEHDLTKVAWLRAFKQLHPYRAAGAYNYRLDAARFAHKSAAVIETGLRKDLGWLLWVDADTVTHAPVSESFVLDLLPTGDEYIAWLDRDDNYPECGLYVLNCMHPEHGALMAEWKRLHTSGDLFKLAEWHDSWVLAELVRQFGLKTKSLSGAGRSTHHPFINGPLGSVMDHLKGGRKRAGRSPSTDLRVTRDESYWRPKQ